MNWIQLTSEQELNEAIAASNETPVLLFKHSTRCSISSTALSRVERNWDDTSKIKPYYLDLIAYRNVSNKIEELLGVYHQSPQAILVKDGNSIYDASHMSINAKTIISKAEELIS